MATSFAYIPSTSDGLTVSRRELTPVPVVADDADDWRWVPAPADSGIEVEEHDEGLAPLLA